MDKYKQVHEQNILNLCREFSMLEKEVRSMYTKAMSEVKEDSKEFYPFKVYRHVRDELKKEESRAQV